MRISNKQAAGRTSFGTAAGLRIAVGATVSILLAACAGSQANQVEEAEVDAVENSADQRVDTIEERGEARNDSIEQSAEVQEDAIESGGETPQSELNEERVELNAEQRTFVSDSQTKLSKLEVRVDEAERKLQLKNKNSQDIKAEIRAARTQIDSIEKDVQRLNTVQAARWDAARADVEHKIAGLAERVELIMDKADG